ncbi:thiamine-phosphate kinase [Erythrobacter litoralis]|uniref:Thiamine-monophosphate kinase n=1 Tax=Erythrobacter litoralis (strain HTCC2594) TaxID=314225 RepID=Q2NCI2_ERYLH|nr:thiamine-phosphate kinase [Erythrobacter litoralis]ABC62609.1 thiamine-monophosphate kinase [Erythrobacter litoralis HTCC2594]
MTNEFDFIARLRALATDPAARGLNDDAAVLEIGGQLLVVTHDMMIEGVHWLQGQDMADVAWKLVAVNLSDLAAKGARPIGIIVGQTIPDEEERFLSGLRDALRAFNVPLLGGDTVSAGQGRTALGLTALGSSVSGIVPGRDGAQPGDLLYITGPVGAAMMGFEALQAGTEDNSLAFRRPMPLLAEGAALAPHVSAMMDVSDGLLLDAWRLATTSGVTLAIDTAEVPLGAPEERRDDALRWGDDYQLLFTASPTAELPARAIPIGTVEEGEPPLLVDGIAIFEPEGLGYRH